MPSRSFFVLDEPHPPVKIKTRTKVEQKSCSSSRGQSQIFHSADLAHRRINSARDRDAAQSGRELPQIQALGYASRKQPGPKTAKTSRKVRCKHRCGRHALPRKIGTVIYRAFTLSAQCSPASRSEPPEPFSNALTQSDEFSRPGSRHCHCIPFRSPVSASAGPVRVPMGRRPGMGRRQADRCVRSQVHCRADHRQLRRPPPIPHHQGRHRHQLSRRRSARGRSLAGHHFGHRQARQPVLASDARDAAREPEAAHVGSPAAIA